LIVADGLRHVAEIDTLKQTFGPRLILVSVESDPSEIARRLIARRRPDESPEALQSEEKAIELLRRELNGQLSALGPNVGQCMARADARIPNHGTLGDLKKTVGEFFRKLTAQPNP
jgi:dephospho-CoA kinase